MGKWYKLWGLRRPQLLDIRLFINWTGIDARGWAAPYLYLIWKGRVGPRRPTHVLASPDAMDSSENDSHCSSESFLN